MNNREERILKEYIENITMDVLNEMSEPEKSLDELISEEVRYALITEKKSKSKKNKSIKAKEQKIKELLKRKPYTQAEVIRNALHKNYKLGSRKDNSDRSTYSKKINGKRPFSETEINKIYNYLTNNMKK